MDRVVFVGRVMPTGDDPEGTPDPVSPKTCLAFERAEHAYDEYFGDASSGDPSVFE